MFSSLGAFGNHLHVQAVGKADDGLDDRGIVFIGGDAAHKGAVDLEHGDGQTLNVDKGRIAGAEVVQGNVDAQLAQTLQALIDGLPFNHHGGFGQLELQTSLGDLVLVHDVGHRLHELLVLELLEGHIDGELDVVIALQRQLVQVLAGLMHHPVAQWDNQPAFLRHRDELSRRQQTPIGVLPAHQPFRTDDAVAGDVDARLVVQHEFLIADGAADLGFQTQYLLRRVRHVLGVELVVAALVTLGNAHGHVGIGEHDIHRHARLLVHGNAHADIHANGMLRYREGLGHGLQDTLEVDATLRLHRPQSILIYNRELIASDAGQRMMRGKAGRNTLGNQLNQGIACALSVGSVYFLELIHVNEQQADGLGRRGIGQHAIELVTEFAAIDQPCQGIHIARVMDSFSSRRHRQRQGTGQ